MSNLHRLVYYSRNTMSGSDAEMEREIRRILEASRRNNERAGVTGALVFNRGAFAQVLEGTLQDVTATFERIQRNPRHGDVLVLQFVPVEARAFGKWSMAFIGRAGSDETVFSSISGESGFDPKTLVGDDVFEAMRRLVLEEEQAAA